MVPLEHIPSKAVMSSLYSIILTSTRKAVIVYIAQATTIKPIPQSPYPRSFGMPVVFCIAPRRPYT